MKKILTILLIILSLVSHGHAQTKTYDILSYTPPSGWSRADKGGSRTYTLVDNKKGIYGLIAIYPAVSSSGSPQKDFTATWNGLVQNVFQTGPVPIPSSVRKVDGYDELTGSSFGKSQGKQTTVQLVNYTGGGKTLSIIINYSDFKYEAATDIFLKSIRLKSPVK